jgi:hypothetical protein
MKINRKEEDREVKKIEGYMDYDRNVFVVTGDPHGLLSNNTPEPKEENTLVDVRDLLKKYRPKSI